MSGLVTIEGLKKYYPTGNLFSRDKIKAVDGVSFSINNGESFGLVGESGSGKTTLGLCLIRLLEPTSGKIIIEGQDFTSMKGKKFKKFRASRLSIVYQNPLSSLDPSWTVEQTLMEPLIVDDKFSESEMKTIIVEALKDVGLPPYIVPRFPHELSGGQAQRVAIARALINKPKIVILDEPTSALDVSIQAQLLNLLLDLQKRYGLTYLFISHDLNVVGHICDTIAVMYLGKMVEIGGAVELFNNPMHPYTQALVSTIPNFIPEFNRYKLKGEPPSPLNPPVGCRFNTRCPYATSVCFTEEPEMVEVTPNHRVACHNIDLVRKGQFQDMERVSRFD
ncbi:MAG: ABC transporter ATP-binding protein [Conexivisphaerales archaeon]